MEQNIITFFRTTQATEYRRFPRLGSRRGGLLCFRPSFGYVGADLAKHRSLCVPQTWGADAAGKQS